MQIVIFLVDYVAGNTQFADGHSKKLYSGQRQIFRHVPANAMAPATGLCGNAEGASLFLHAMCFGDELLPLGIRRDLLSLKWPVKNVADSSYGLGLDFKTFEREQIIRVKFGSFTIFPEKIFLEKSKAAFI